MDSLLSGSIAGIVADVATHPLGTVKTRLQVQGASASSLTRYGGVAQGLTRILTKKKASARSTRASASSWRPRHRPRACSSWETTRRARRCGRTCPRRPPVSRLAAWRSSAGPCAGCRWIR